MNRWIYICDDCGSIVTIESAPLPDDEYWVCDDCGGADQSAFTDQDAALAQSNTIREANFNAEMATLDRKLRELGAR